MTDVRLAHGGPPKALQAALSPSKVACSHYVKPSVLVSYVYLKAFLSQLPGYDIREWVMDSGAYSAHNTGTVVTNQGLIDTAKSLRDQLQQPPVEVFALDVIGNWRAGVKNCEQAWKQGVQAIPCYHVGDPPALLKSLARDYPKIALGGSVGYSRKLDWARACFDRVWPAKIHGFGYGGRKSILALPWHTVDATNWELGPTKFGSWKTYGKMSVRGGSHNLRPEVAWYMRLETAAKFKWRAEMAELEAATKPPCARQVGSP